VRRLVWFETSAISRRGGHYLSISFTVLNFRLAITFRRLGAPFPSSLDLERRPSRPDSAEQDVPLHATISQHTALAPPQVLTSLSELSLLESKRPSGGGSSS